jgi:hypothetical protein
MHICLIWMLLVCSILGRFLLLYWDVSFVRLNKFHQIACCGLSSVRVRGPITVGISLKPAIARSIIDQGIVQGTKCYIWSLVCSECLIETWWLILYGFGLQISIPGTLYFY